MRECRFVPSYGYITVSPTSCYEGKNVEEVRFASGFKMAQTDKSEVGLCLRYS